MGGDDRNVSDGFVDTLILNGRSGDINGTLWKNWERIRLRFGSDLRIVDGHLEAAVHGGGGSGLVIDDTSRLFVDRETLIDADCENNGTIDLQEGSFSTLRISGDYRGGGVIALDTVLNDGDPSISDRIVVEGDTSGTTVLRLRNRGGTGGLTGESRGILLVAVHGTSAGRFVLDHEPVISGFHYFLSKGTDGNWYLYSHGTPLIAHDDRYEVQNEQWLAASVASNDQTGTCHPESAHWVLVDPPRLGELDFDGDGHFRYLAHSDCRDHDRFRYRIEFAGVCPPSNTATVSITIHCPEPPCPGDSGGVPWWIVFMGIGIIFLVRSPQS